MKNQHLYRKTVHEKKIRSGFGAGLRAAVAVVVLGLVAGIAHIIPVDFENALIRHDFFTALNPASVSGTDAANPSAAVNTGTEYWTLTDESGVTVSVSHSGTNGGAHLHDLALAYQIMANTADPAGGSTTTGATCNALACTANRTTDTFFTWFNNGDTIFLADSGMTQTVAVDANGVTIASMMTSPSTRTDYAVTGSTDSLPHVAVTTALAFPLTAAMAPASAAGPAGPVDPVQPEKPERVWNSTSSAQDGSAGAVNVNGLVAKNTISFENGDRALLRNGRGDKIITAGATSGYTNGGSFISGSGALTKPGTRTLTSFGAMAVDTHTHTAIASGNGTAIKYGNGTLLFNTARTYTSQTSTRRQPFASQSFVFDVRSGEIYAGLPGAIMETDRRFGEVQRSRLSGQNPGMMSGELTPGTTLWFSADRQKNTADGTTNTGKAELSSWGASLGVEKTVSDWTLGAAFRYGDGEYEVNSRASEADIDSFNLALYAGRPVIGDFNVKLGAGYGLHQVESKRHVAFVTQRLKGDYDVHTVQAFGEVGWLKTFEAFSIEPYAGLSWNYAKNDSFTETGGSAALCAKSGENDNFASNLGVRGRFQPLEKVVIGASLDYQHLFGDNNPESRFAFLGGKTFSIEGAPMDRNSIGLGADVDLMLKENLSLKAGYLGRFGEDTDSHAGYLTVEVAF